ncbi:MAG: Hsp20/alpha crystallin family protein [archaeon]|nr:Hsp20/alpha crystallin family protein [Candidatus Micrarchaeota archaeon]
MTFWLKKCSCDPFEEMHRILDFPVSTKESFMRPLSDVWEDEKNVYASVELPGLRKEDIDINVTDEGIEVKAEKKAENEEKDKNYYRLERNYAGFYKFIALPENVDSEKAEASYSDGILEVKIPKTEKTESKKKIKVN